MMERWQMYSKNIEVGDEIIIKKGIARQEKEVKDVVINIDGFSLLTSKGIEISCRDARGIEKTGKRPKNYQVTSKAKKILERVRKEKEEEKLNGYY
jgi:hypothetical protein